MARDYRLNTNNSAIAEKKKEKKENWPVVSARIPNNLRKKLEKMYPKRGQLSDAIKNLLENHVQVLGY